MSFAVYFLCTSILQFSSAQVFSYVQRNSVPQQVERTARYVSNVAINNAITNPSSAMIARVPTAGPVANNVATSANANINTVNAISNQNIAREYAIQNLANANYANAANVASQNAVNAITNAASQNAVNAITNAASQNAVNAIATNEVNALATNAANYANAYANQNIAVNAVPAALTINSVPATIVNTVPAAIANTATPVAKANLNNAALASAATLANIDGNMATFNLGTNGNTFTISSGSPGMPGFGVSITADALEVGGSVAVNGQIPIFGSVAFNGNVPTDGAATVSYNCGTKQVPVSV